MSGQKAKESYIRLGGLTKSSGMAQELGTPYFCAFCSCHFSSLAASKKNGEPANSAEIEERRD
jgi:hypothetical protein